MCKEVDPARGDSLWKKLSNKFRFWPWVHLVLPLVGLGAGAGIGFAGTLILQGWSPWLNYQIQASRIRVQMTQIALSMLTGKSKEDTSQSRKFAIEMLAQYADVPLVGIDVNQWATTGATDVNALPYDYSYSTDPGSSYSDVPQTAVSPPSKASRPTTSSPNS